MYWSEISLNNLFKVDHVCKWDFNVEFDSFVKSSRLQFVGDNNGDVTGDGGDTSDFTSVSRYQSSNISRMTYKKSPKGTLYLD